MADGFTDQCLPLRDGVTRLSVDSRPSGGSKAMENTQLGVPQFFLARGLKRARRQKSADPGFFCRGARPCALEAVETAGCVGAQPCAPTGLNQSGVLRHPLKPTTARAHDYSVGTRRLSSSNQLRTTMISVGTRSCSRWIIRNRCPSGEMS